MTLTKIAMQNLRRRKGKSIFLLSTFCLVVGIIVTLNTLATALQEDLQKSLTQYGANIVITPRSEHFNLSYGGISIPGIDYEIKTLEQPLLDKIKENEANILIAPKVIGSAEENSQRYLIVGVDFPTELKMKPWWVIHGQIPQDDQIVIGSNQAQKGNLTVGDKLTLNNHPLTIVGIMQQTGGSEDNAIFSTISTSRSITGITDSWSIIELNSMQPEKDVPKLASLLPTAKVSAVSQLVQGTEESVERFSSFSLWTSVLLALIGTLIIVVTLSGNVNDRIAELGIFRAIGFRKKHITSILIREIIILSLTGGLFGYLAGILLPIILNPLIFAKPLSITFHPLLGFIAIVLTIVFGLIALAYPTWKALKLDPVEALRYI